MKKHWLDLALFVLLGPLLPAASAAFGPTATASANAYMVENTTGTGSCYEFQTTPTCFAQIQGLSVSTTSVASIFSSSNTWTGTNTYKSTSTFQGPFSDGTSDGTSGQIWTSNGNSASWQATPAGVTTSSTNTWTGGNTWTGANTFTSSVTITGSRITVSTVAFNNTATGGILGTQTNDSAAQGMYGEFISSLTATSCSFPASNAVADGLSITLTKGDWDISAVMFGQAVALTSNLLMAISTTSGNSLTGANAGDNRVDVQTAGATGTDSLSIPVWRLSLNATTPVYYKIQSTYTGSAPTYLGRLSARRVR